MFEKYFGFLFDVIFRCAVETFSEILKKIEYCSFNYLSHVNNNFFLLKENHHIL